LASLSHAQSTVAEPVVRPRPRTKPRSKPRSKTRKRTQTRARGGILWIAVSGILLAGVVFVNVAVLRLNLSLDSANSERTKLRAENAALQSNLSRELASAHIETRAAKEFGLTYADPSQYGYVNLGKK
jgi:cell division protein FtsL